MLTVDEALDPLAEIYGEPAPPPQRSILDLVLLENIVYLADDTQRAAAFEALQRNVGTRPQQLLAVPDETLIAATNRGILPEHQAAKLRQIASLTLSDFDGDLESLRSLPLAQAPRALKKFPSIGDPGAEKILLFARSHAVLGLDSNGVRVLCRLGVDGLTEAKSYAATYRRVQEVAAPYARSRGIEWLIRAHQLLREHGQTLCKRSRPLCERCPLSDRCAYAGTGDVPGAPSADHVSPR